MSHLLQESLTFQSSQKVPPMGTTYSNMNLWGSSHSNYHSRSPGKIITYVIMKITKLRWGKWYLLAVLSEDLDLVPSTHAEWFTTTHLTSFSGFYRHLHISIFLSLSLPFSLSLTHTHGRGEANNVPSFTVSVWLWYVFANDLFPRPYLYHCTPFYPLHSSIHFHFPSWTS